ncbi:MAG: hypothetical protein WKG00_37970 [Polyangiaceae bacterium]
MKHGIAPLVLASQVAATAGWALEEGASGAAATPAAATVRGAAQADAVWRAAPASVEYLRLLLAAHYLTVGTFCPTDVDARIRHHFWLEIEHAEQLARAIDEVDAVAALDPRLVSARVLTEGDATAGRDRTLSGHDGEWFSVRAGALGCALAMGDAGRDAAARLQASIDDELARECAIFEARVGAGDATSALSAATTLAHNVGDLSRVVEAWPKNPAVEAVRLRYARLGHEPDRDAFGGSFYVAGAVNKSIMAIENHRFLALRAPRALRRSRELLLPFGPFFYEWGMTVARTLEEEERAEVVAALIETHLSRVEQSGVLRAIAGIAEANAGPWGRIVANLPARLRKLATTGAVQAAIGTPERAFLARTDNRYRAALREAQALRDASRRTG